MLAGLAHVLALVLSTGLGALGAAAPPTTTGPTAPAPAAAAPAPTASAAPAPVVPTTAPTTEAPASPAAPADSAASVHPDVAPTPTSLASAAPLPTAHTDDLPPRAKTSVKGPRTGVHRRLELDDGSQGIHSRFGVDGGLLIGAEALWGGSVRFEARSSPHSTNLFRLGAASIPSSRDYEDQESPAVRIIQLQVGHRWYRHSFYAGIEGGLWLVSDSEVSGAVPMIFAGAGTKLGPLDLGIDVSAPLTAVSFHLGVDLELPLSRSTRSAPKAASRVSTRSAPPDVRSVAPAAPLSGT